jgi:hypothetical protein
MRRLIWLTLALAGCAANDGNGMPDGGMGGDGGLCSAPTRLTARRDVDAIVLPGGGKALVYGGDQAPPDLTLMGMHQELDDVWQVELGCGNWTQVVQSSAAGARGGYASAIDTKRNRLIIFGGQKGAQATPVVSNDVWALDLATLTWSQLMPSGTIPASRVGARMIYDADHDRALLFGGTKSRAGTGLADLEELSFAASADGAWTQLSNGGTGTPTGRFDAAATVDTKRKLMLVFGGAGDFMTFFDELWAFDLTSNQWRLLTMSGGGPSQRLESRITYDAGADQLWMFGGHDLSALGYVNDTWSAHLDAGGTTVTWAPVLGGDVSLSIGGVDGRSPERRGKHGLFLDGGKLWTVVGGGDCGSLDDVWSLDLSSPMAWSKLVPALQGESCYRRAMPGQSCPTDIQMECAAPF